MSFNPKNWRVTLPVFKPSEVMDYSENSEYGVCPRRGFYKYGMRRGFSHAPVKIEETVLKGKLEFPHRIPELEDPSAKKDKNYAIQWGLAYHKYRELVEVKCEELGTGINNEIHNEAVSKSLLGWEDPPIGHKHEHLKKYRMIVAMNIARKRIEEEQRTGKVKVTRSEEPFDLEMDWWICLNCGFTYWTEQEDCNYCGSTHLLRARHGGRVDQHIIFQALNNAKMIRDFKTTQYMGKTYDKKFDPNGQIQGYVWSGEKLSGRRFEGALIETLYTTKTVGPEIHQTYVTYSPGQQEAWEASMMMERQLIMSMWARVEELGFLAFPMRTTACPAFGGCPYREACRSSSGWEIEQWLENYTIYSHWDFTNPDLEESVL